MKKQQLSCSWGKRILSTVTSLAVAASLLPASPVLSAKAEEPLLKAGSISVTAENVTLEQPFKSGTAGSGNFRIPALISLKNGEHKGTLVAAADARYATSGDGGGLDTIASVSEDGGKTWSYSFPLYFPDSEGYAGNTATTIIDPGILEGADGTIYCFADVNPTGSTTMYKTIGTGTGYVTVNGKRRLAITDNYANVETEPADADTATYAYYVGDFTDGYAPILKRADGAATGYGVDEWYNLYTVENGKYVANLMQKQVNSDTDIQQNVFYKDSKYHVYSIGYIWMITSKDGGKTWEHPVDLNDQVKRRTNEHAILVSPGQGITTKDGTLVLGMYDHGGAGNEENASIIYSSDNGKTWKRSNDISGGWTSENEIVELEDGTLRMFVRSGQGVVSYADYTKNAQGEYVAGSLQRTGAAVTSTCNVTAISYSKKVDGKQAILVGMPGGSGRANGKIFTFLVNADKSMTLKSTFSVPNAGPYYAYSCMTELEDGSIGLLWEHEGAQMRYDNFSILDLTDGYVEGATKNVELWANETLTRSYTIDAAYATGVTKEADPQIADVKVEGEQTEASVNIPLHAHTSNTASSLNSFSQTADGSLDIENAEFTITAAGGENTYKIYNNAEKVYIKNSGANQYFDAGEATMYIEKTADASTFRISQEAGSGYMYFHLPEMNFNRMGGYQSANAAGYEMTLLEKKEAGSADDLVFGYQEATEVKSGSKYLIAYEFNGRTIILYPVNGVNNQTKLVGTPEVTPAGKTVTREITITGKAEGDTSVTIDGMTYQIHCKGNPKIDLVLGQKYFIKDAEEFSAATPDAVSVEAGKEKRKALFDCTGGADHSLSGYSDVPNWDINMSVSEFVVTKEEEGYSIYNPAEEVYLRNDNATSYFGAGKYLQNLTPVSSEGGTSFEISRGDGRYMYFFYEKMAFDGLSEKSDSWKSRGDFGFELLKKKDMVTNLDPIPGYERASEIVSGEKYLITEYYKDTDGTEAIIVLYPRNGIVNQSKMYKEVEVDGAVITAKKQGNYYVTVDGIVYEVRVSGECSHSEKRVENMVAATCTEAGTTGDTYCNICNEKISAGEAIPATGHSWGEWTVTTPATPEADGVETRVCANDASHTETRPISALDAAKDALSGKITEAQAEAAKDIYTAETLAALNTALTEANTAAGKENATKDELNAARTKLEEALGNLVTKAVQEKKDELNQLVTEDIDLSIYTPETKKAVEDAIAEANEILADKNATEAQLTKAIEKIVKAKEALMTPAEKAFGEANEAMDAQLKDAEELLAQTGIYTADSLAALTKAVHAAKAVRNDASVQANKDAAAVTKAAQELAKAVKALVTLDNQAAEDAKAALSAAKSVYDAGQKDYTAETWNAFKAAYEALNSAGNKDAAELAKLTAALVNAQAKLAKSGQNEEVKPGVAYPSGNYMYKVISTEKKTAQVVGIVSAKVGTLKKITVYNSVKLGKDTYKVVAVAPSAFKNNKVATSAVIKGSVEKIGKQAFAGCKKLKKVTIGSKKLKQIDAKAFYNSKKLTSIVIKSTALTKVGKNALKGISKKATIKVPKKQYKKYAKLLAKKGQAKSVKIKK